MPKVQSVGSRVADFWARVQEAWKIIRNGIPKPPADRVARGAVIVQDDVLSLYATHQSGVKRQMARELLAARSVIFEARRLAAASESLYAQATDEKWVEWMDQTKMTTDAIHEYDCTFTNQRKENAGA